MTSTNPLRFPNTNVALHEEASTNFSPRTKFSTQRFPMLLDTLSDEFEDLIDDTDLSEFGGVNRLFSKLDHESNKAVSALGLCDLTLNFETNI